MIKEQSIFSAFGKAVKKERVKKGVTQEELADRCGLDRTYISRIERGQKNPTLSVIWQVATLGLGMDFLSLMELTVQHLPVDTPIPMHKLGQNDPQ